MGVETRKLPLPAPTESSTVQTSGDSVNGTDLATDLSRRTDRTSYSIPEDGSPIVISTKKKKDHKERGNTPGRPSHQSQTSLLIEYFEGGKGPNPHSRPSVRVKVTPSTARKNKDTNEHIQITQAGAARKPSYTRRISLGHQATSEHQPQVAEGADDRSISSYTSAAEESGLAGRRPPIEIEVLNKDQGSDLSGASAPRDERYNQQTTSDISSMPPDSMLEGNAADYTPHYGGSRGSHREVLVAENTLKTPPRTKDRSVSRERITQKVIEKLESRPRDVSGKKHRHGTKTRSRSGSEELIPESGKSHGRRSSRHRAEEELPSGAESSLLTASQLSANQQSGDQYSFRSGTSHSSVNNLKLLQTVEDAIRRIILPEFTALKHEQKAQQNRTNFEQDNRRSVGSSSTNSRGEVIRQVSKHASAPDVSGKPKVVLNQDEANPGIVLSGDSLKGRKEYGRDRVLESPSERSFDPGISEETVVRDDGKLSMKRSKDSHRGQNAAAAGAVGGVLTSAALKNHDSRSSIDRQERRRKRSSKSRSRSTSLAAESTEEIFQRHDVPPMPMRSDIDESELTRDSILSERTENPSSDRRRAEIRQVSRGSPREVLSPAARTPTRTPVPLQKGFGTHHSNHSRGDLSVHSTHSDRSIRDEERHSKFADVGLSGTAAGASWLAADHLLNQDSHYDEYTFSHRAQNRGLSPIQSVASYDEDVAEQANRHSLHHGPSSASISSLGQERHKGAAVSIKSLSSAASTDLARSRRPQGINLEGGEEVLDQHGLGNYKSTQDERAAMETWYNEQHEQNDRYRDSFAENSSRDPTIDYKHMTNYTDDSLDAPDLDKVAAAHQVRGIGANPEYIHTPLAVESAVASLHDPSVLDVSTRSARSKGATRSYSGSLNDAHQEAGEYSEVSDRGLGINQHGSAMKQYDAEGGYEPGLARKIEGRMATSPQQSIARSLDDHDEPVTMGASGLPLPDDPMPEIGHGLDSDESDINTNPSIIQGPIGGPPHNNLDHWPYNPTPPESKGDILGHSKTNSAHESLKAAAAGMLSAAALAAGRDRGNEDKGYSKEIPQDEYGQGVNHDFGPIQDSYMTGHTIPTPPMAKDEGYISAANPRSPAGLSPIPKAGGPRLFDDESMAGDDPFMDRNHVRHLSGYSQGMASPLYDSATGKGIDRIQSKDIVALMDHLTVRDARRNARDTEILVTLVRSAAEMRNSFEDMKKFIAEQDEMLIDTGSKQHDRTAQKIINGPRPQPLGTPRTPRQHSTEDMDDLPTKRRNVFKRALKGLSIRSSNDLGKIEDMLVQILGEVEGLKAAQDGGPSGAGARPDSLNSYDNLRTPANDGYEPEGQAGTSSTPNQSGYFSNSSLQQGNTPRGYDGRRGSQNRVSTVLEGDEELDEDEQNLLDHQFENSEKIVTPTQELNSPTQELRGGGSAPVDTPPQVHVPTGTQSSEHTPKNGTDRNRKHKSSSSSFFPKISRWSKTTASSVGDNFRGNSRRERPFSEASRSGSDVNINPTEHYSPQSNDRLRSSDSFKHHAHDSFNDSPGSAPSQENRPPSPLVPSQVSEGPKYQAHRNSLNLQHPQPRQGPTHRYQTHLESQAQNFTGSPLSPSSDQFGSNPTLARFAPTGPGNRYGGNLAGHLSPISDTQSEASGTAPARPPKVRDDGPLVPQRPPKIDTQDRGAYGSPRNVERLATVPEGGRYSNGSAGCEQANGSSPHSGSGQRGAKLTGPRPISESGSWSPDKGQAMAVGGINAVKKHRFRGSPNFLEEEGGEDDGRSWQQQQQQQQQEEEEEEVIIAFRMTVTTSFRLACPRELEAWRVEGGGWRVELRGSELGALRFEARK